MKGRGRQLPNQPRPRIPGLSRHMIQLHAARLFRDVIARRPLTEQEWRLAEVDLARKLENAGM